MNFKLTKLLKYSIIGGVAAGSLISFSANNYDLNSIALVRLGRAAITVADIGYMYQTRLYNSKLNESQTEYKILKSECHKIAANKLLNLCCANKGVYIKVGQHIGALDYLLPKEYVETLKVLHSHAPINDIKDIYKVLREDFKKDPKEIFKSIETEPLGAASLAQVHRAILHDGSVVAVKVQHPYVKGNSLVDLKTMEVLVKIMAYVFPEFKFQWLVNETKKNIPRELNFIEEGQNAERVSKLFSNYKWLKVPKVFWDLTTSRVLTMEFVEGGQINDLDYIVSNKIDPYDVANKLGKLYSQMIFIYGFVHSDPHPGNILLKKNNNGSTEVILLDHGLYADLTPKFRHLYAKLWISILNKDRKTMAIVSEELGIKNEMYPLFACMVTGRTWDKILEGIDQVDVSKNERKLMKQEFPSLIPKISDVLENCDRQMLLIFKTNDLMRSIESTLKTQSRMTSFICMSKYCVDSVCEEKLKKTNTILSKYKLKIVKSWTKFKLNLYYIYLGTINFQLFSTIKFIIYYS